MKTILMAAAAVSALVASSAGAETLTFEGQSNKVYAAPLTLGNFVVANPTGDEQHFHLIDATQFGVPSNGTGVLLNDRNTRIQFTRVGGGLFSLSSFDSANDGGNASQLTVTGFLAGAQTYTANFAIGSSFATNAFSNLSFDRVLFDGTGGTGGFELDNVVINAATANAAVPEPATWAMMMLGFGGMGYAMRRKAKVSTRIRFA